MASIQGDKGADIYISKLENILSASEIEKAKKMTKSQSLKTSNFQIR